MGVNNYKLTFFVVMKLIQKRIMKADGVAQVVECLPSKCEALSSNTSKIKKFLKCQQSKLWW
jgi:hypothetical protein